MSRMRQVYRSAFRFAAPLRAGWLAARYGAERLDRLWRGPGVAPAYLELDNKVRAFGYFETVGTLLQLGHGPLLPAQAIREARRRLGHEPSVWATEGIGYELVERRRRGGRPTDGLLRAPDPEVPTGSWATLHTGMGMALADEALAGLRPGEPEAVRRALEEHVERCAAAARVGYQELAFEPLGLVARILEPAAVPAIGRALAGMGGPWRDLFWHGVGRGLYFLPANLPPTRSAPWAGLRSCTEEPPTGRDRGNAAAGFSWAVSLVNLRHPAVVEAFLARHADEPGPPDGPQAPVAQGVGAALLLWHEASGGSAELRRFIAHEAAPQRRALWERVVRAPFAEALARGESPGNPADPRRLADLFRCC